MNFLVVHGTCGSSGGNWFPWLGGELEKRGHAVRVPDFPTPVGQSFYAWKSVAEKNMLGWNTADTVLIGHSIGAVFVLRLVEDAKEKFSAVFSVCPFAHTLGLEEFDALNKSFIEHEFRWSDVKKGAEKIICFAGEDDPYVPLSYSKEIAERVASELVIVNNGGHLNAEAGYREFPLLLERIRLHIDAQSSIK